jgi:hypothetical protein
VKTRSGDKLVEKEESEGCQALSQSAEWKAKAKQWAPKDSPVYKYFKEQE